MSQQASRPEVVVTRALPEGWLDSLAHRFELHVGPAERAGFGPELHAALERAEGLLTMLTERVDAELLDQAPRLRVVSNMAVGVDNIDVPACSERGIPVGNTPGVLTDATADLSFALLLAAARRLPEASEDARAGRWNIWSPTGWLGSDLQGATLGIVGLGKIGTAVAQRARPFGMNLLYTARNRRLEAERELGVQWASFEQLLERSDFVSVHVPLSARTRKLFDETALRTMKRSAILINTARGPIVDPTALRTALEQGWIAAAALDVTDPEPLPASDPLFRLPNAIITPHIGSATAGTRRKMAQLACDNLVAGLEGSALPHCVNPEVYG